MGSRDETPVDPASSSARELLERLHYGHSPALEAILRFASAHKLDDDNLVFLLVSILKGNEELVKWLLQAAEGTDRVIDNARQSGKELRALGQALVVQIEESSSRSATKLNLAADRLSNTVARVDELCSGIVAAADDLRRVEGVLNRAVEIREGKNALDRLVDQIRRQAQADLKTYHSEIMEELSLRVTRKAWATHAYGITALILVASVVLWHVVALSQ